MTASAEIYADATRFQAWLEKAAPGESFLYAIAGGLDQQQPVVVAVARAIEVGAVLPVQRGTPGERRYQVQRCSRPSTARTSSSAARTSSSAARGERGRGALPRLSPVFAATPEGQLFALLCEIAEAGLPCPGLTELARRLAWEDRQQVRYRLRRLESSGHISMTLSDERVPWRTITITETGARTAPAGGTRSGARPAHGQGRELS